MTAVVRPGFWLLLVALMAVPTLDARAAAAPKNLLNNGSFRVGSGNSVDGWRQDAWIQDPGSTDYIWHPPEPGKPGELEVLSHRDNDARWSQLLSLGPGWYHISVESRAIGAQPFTTGANISLLEDGITSRDLRGTTDWQRIGFYLRIGSQGADVEVALRLGGFGRLTRGDARFREARVVKVAGPQPGEPAYDLVAIRKASATGPIGSPWTLVATLLFLLLLAAVGWRMIAEPPAAVEAKVEQRASRKRKAGAR